MHLDAGYNSGKTPETLADADCPGRSRTRARRHPSRPADVGMSSAPMPGTTRSTGSNAATNPGEAVIDAFFDLADAIITARSLIRQAWTTHRWDTRSTRRP